MRSVSRRRRFVLAYRPHLDLLEARLSLGDTVLGPLTGLLLAGQNSSPGTAAAVAPAGGQVHGFGLDADLTVFGLEPCYSVRAGGSPVAHAVAWSARLAVPEAANPWMPRADAGIPGATVRPMAVSGTESAGVVPAGFWPSSGGAAVGPGVPPAASAVAPASDLGALLAAVVNWAAPGTGTATVPEPAVESSARESLGGQPLYFEQNVGQTDASVQFLARGPGYGLFLTGTEAVMVLNPPKAAAGVGQDSHPAEWAWQDRNPDPQLEAPSAVVRMQFLGGNPVPRVMGVEQQPGLVNYFLGNDPAKWHTNVATFAKVQYDEVYPGIDLVWYATAQNQLEYDFVVAPGADPNAIRLNVSGVEQLEIDAAGDLLLHVGAPGGAGQPARGTAGSILRQHKPFVYQEVGGVRQEVASRFVLHDTASGVSTTPRAYQVSFDVAAYDAARPLVIDPVLSYSTYLGGSGADSGNALAVDPATGDVLVTGTTSSTNFPTASPFQPSNRGGDDAFVTRLSADGSTLIWSTYLGGTGPDAGNALAVDAATGDVLVGGDTQSTNFPTASPFQPTNRGTSEAFVARLRGDGAALGWSTYLGGSDWDRGLGLTVDPATGDALLTGLTASTNFPTASPFQPSIRGGDDAFVTRLRADGAALVWSTYLGGTGADVGNALTVDAATGDVLITGDTRSTNFPTANPAQGTNGGASDAFVTRLNANGASLAWSTYLGGSGNDFGTAVAVDPTTGETLVTGRALSTNFPTVNPFQSGRLGGSDAFVTRLSTDGTALVWSTYFGGGAIDQGLALAVDPATGDVFLVGRTSSTNLPRANPLQSAFGGGASDAFVTRLRADGAALVWSTYLGGNDADFAATLAVDATTGNVVLAGVTQSTNFPTTAGAYDRTCGTDGQCNPVSGVPVADAFVTRIGSAPVAGYGVEPFYTQVTAGVAFDVTVTALDAGGFVIPDYTGEVLIIGTDEQGTTPLFYTFQRSARGAAFFAAGVTFRTPGLQLLLVLDTATFTAIGLGIYEVA